MPKVDRADQAVNFMSLWVKRFGHRYYRVVDIVPCATQSESMATWLYYIRTGSRSARRHSLTRELRAFLQWIFEGQKCPAKYDIEVMEALRQASYVLLHDRSDEGDSLWSVQRSAKVAATAATGRAASAAPAQATAPKRHRVVDKPATLLAPDRRPLLRWNDSRVTSNGTLLRLVVSNKKY